MGRIGGLGRARRLLLRLRVCGPCRLAGAAFGRRALLVAELHLGFYLGRDLCCARQGMLEFDLEAGAGNIEGAVVARCHLAKHGVDRHLRCHLTGGSSAHAVANDQQGAPRSDSNVTSLCEVRFTAVEVNDQKIVFVVLADQPNVGHSDDANGDGRIRRRHKISMLGLKPQHLVANPQDVVGLQFALSPQPYIGPI